MWARATTVLVAGGSRRWRPGGFEIEYMSTVPPHRDPIPWWAYLTPAILAVVVTVALRLPWWSWFATALTCYVAVGIGIRLWYRVRLTAWSRKQRALSQPSGPHSEAGWAAYQRGELAEAEREFRSATAGTDYKALRDPRIRRDHLNLAVTLVAMNKLDEGLDAMREALRRVDPLGDTWISYSPLDVFDSNEPAPGGLEGINARNREAVAFALQSLRECVGPTCANPLPALRRLASEALSMHNTSRASGILELIEATRPPSPDETATSSL
jgi:hypothetical protein